MVYVGHSTRGQMLPNHESTRLEYQFRDLALALGWRPERIQVIDDNLGVSGSGEVHRNGFECLTLAVSRGEVGAMFGLDASRLSRNEVDWFQLLRWLRTTDTLVSASALDGLASLSSRSPPPNRAGTLPYAEAEWMS